MANWIYNLLHGKLPGKGFLGRSSTGSGPGELLDSSAARALLGSSGRDFATVAAAEAATYTEPEHCSVTETGKVYVYVSSSTATVDNDDVLSVENGTGRLLTVKSTKNTETFQATLVIATGDWVAKSVTKTVTGITATGTVWVGPAEASYVTYTASGIRATTQGTNQLSFVCTVTPTVDVTVNIAYTLAP